MTDTLATKQDLKELESRMDARFGRIDTQLEELEKRLNLSTARQIADLRSQMTVQMMVHTLAVVGAVSALVKLL